MREVSYDETKAVLEGLVKGSEDFVYEPPAFDGCVNWVVDAEGKRVGSCIVGQTIAKIDPNALKAIDDGGDAYGSNFALIEQAVMRFDESAVQLLVAVQARQDGGKPWGLALGEAIDEVENN